MAMTWGKEQKEQQELDKTSRECIEIFFTEIPASVGGIPQVPSPQDAKEWSLSPSRWIAPSESKSFSRRWSQQHSGKIFFVNCE